MEYTALTERELGYWVSEVAVTVNTSLTKVLGILAGN